MSTEVLERRFAAIGARVKVASAPGRSPTIDVASDRRGEFFEIRVSGTRPPVALEVVAAEPADRHLLLLVRESGEKSKFLCGHDERHWFVAAVPEAARGVNGVVAAKLALQPELVRTAVRRTQPKDPLRRHNPAYVRQGEWFFVPAERLDPPAWQVHRNEPLSRGRGKPHRLEEAFRTGGRTVWVSRRHPRGISDARYARLTEPQRRQEAWQPFILDPELYARGAVRHPDHATVVLDGWHRVAMNTEQQARAMRHVVFVD
jgi:hypothetical protein